MAAITTMDFYHFPLQELLAALEKQIHLSWRVNETAQSSRCKTKAFVAVFSRILFIVELAMALKDEIKCILRKQEKTSASSFHPECIFTPGKNIQRRERNVMTSPKTSLFKNVSFEFFSMLDFSSKEALFNRLLLLLWILLSTSAATINSWKCALTDCKSDSAL